MSKKNIILLYGKSGSGKDYLCDILGLERVVSYTTRPQRYEEEHGVQHYFVTLAEAGVMIPDAVSLTKFDGNYYWATLDEILIKSVYIIDFKGIQSFKRTIGSRIIYRIVTVEAPWYRRLYRMFKREAYPWKFVTIRKVLSRLLHDRKMFPRIPESPVIRT